MKRNVVKFIYYLQVNVINLVTFRKAFSEWWYCQCEIDNLCGQDWTKRPPCTIHQHSCHVDGNEKVYRFKLDYSIIFRC